MMELLFFNSKKMFLSFCVLLVAGSLVQGFPTRTEEYQRIRCTPEDNDIGCLQEQAIFDQAQESNVIDRSPISKKVQTYVPFSAEDLGSGNSPFSGEDPGSASEYAEYSNEIKNSKQQFYEENLII
ncbi:serglycin [Bufo bufo]|uniref:serglycin n=1 Tax=Bufo bufo TaxID=8384 RepID=UPI001ABDBF1B|nr:serglycin [Bufo bufo]